MATEKKKREFVPLPPKNSWHLYSLQNITCEKLVKVVNKILKHEFMLIK